MNAAEKLLLILVGQIALIIYGCYLLNTTTDATSHFSGWFCIIFNSLYGAQIVHTLWRDINP